MNEAVKRISERLKELDINYELTEEKNGLIISLLSEEIDLSVRYLIDTMKFEDGTYKLTIFTSELLKVKNEFEVLKVLNDINWNSSFIHYLVSEKKQVHIKIDSIDTIDSIANDAVGLISDVVHSLEENYDKIMKSNWS